MNNNNNSKPSGFAINDEYHEGDILKCPNCIGIVGYVRKLIPNYYNN